MPPRSFDPILFHRWRCFGDYGTGMAGDLMVHLVSGMQCITGINALPDQAYTVGGIRRWKDGRNMPDVQTTVFTYGAVPVLVRLSLGTESPETTRILGSHGMIEIVGSTLTLLPQAGVDRSPDYGLSGWPAADRAAFEKQWHAEHDAELSQHPLAEATTWHEDNWNDLHPHLANFYRSVRTRKPPVEDAVFGHHAAGACHMANASYFERTVVKRTA